MKLRAITVLVVFLSNILFSSVSFADDTQNEILDAVSDSLLDDATISPMKKNQPAPFDGVLLSPTATASIIAQIKAMKEQLLLEIEHAKKEEQTRCQYKIDDLNTMCSTDKKVLAAQIDQQKSRIDLLSTQLDKEINNKPNVQLWTGIGVGVGFVVGVGLSALTIYAIGQASN